jgi:acetyl-CoA synthetase
MGGADGHRTALIAEAADGTVERYTFHVLRLLSNKLAHVLAARGLGPGDRVAVALPQGVETAVAVLAALRMGAIVVPIPASFGLEPLAWRLSHSGARAAILDPAMVPLLRGLAADDLPELELLLSPYDAAMAESGEAEDMWAAITDAPDSFPPAVTDADAPAFLFYPEQASGRPGAVVHAHRAMPGGLPALEMALDFFPQTGDVLWTPCDWMGFEGLMWGLLPAWHHGVTVVAKAGPWNPVHALEVMARHGVRAFYAPPGRLRELTSIASVRPHLMPRAIATGPEPLSWSEHERVRKVFGVSANEVWGSPTVGAVVANNAGLMERHSGSPGRAAPGVSVDVVDAGGRPARAGSSGPLAASPNAPSCFLGWWRDPDATRDAVLGGWTLSGINGQRDLDGYVTPLDQGAGPGMDMVDGKWVRLADVEDALKSHAQVADAVVTGFGGELRAFVTTKTGRAGDAEFARELQAWVGARRAAHEIPRRVEFADTLPAAAEGKDRRGELLARPLRLDAPSIDDRLTPHRK